MPPVGTRSYSMFPSTEVRRDRMGRWDRTTRARKYPAVNMCWRNCPSACEYDRFQHPTNTLIADLSQSGKGKRPRLVESISADQTHGWLLYLPHGSGRNLKVSSWIFDLHWISHPVTTASTPSLVRPSSETSDGRASLVRCPTVLHDYTSVSGLRDMQQCSSHVRRARRVCIK